MYFSAMDIPCLEPTPTLVLSSFPFVEHEKKGIVVDNLFRCSFSCSAVRYPVVRLASKCFSLRVLQPVFAQKDTQVTIARLPQSRNKEECWTAHVNTHQTESLSMCSMICPFIDPSMCIGQDAEPYPASLSQASALHDQLTNCAEVQRTCNLQRTMSNFTQPRELTTRRHQGRAMEDVED